MSAAAFGLALAALILLALSLPRHAGQAGVPRSRWGRHAGWALLALSLAATLAAARPTWGIALVEWIGGVGLGAAIVMLLLTYRPRLLPRLAPLVAIAFLLVTVLLR